MNKTNKVSNVHSKENEDKTNDFQAMVELKAKGLVEYLKQSPVARLVPTLRVTEHGIIPDVRLSLVGDKEIDNEPKTNTNTGDEEGDAGDGGEGGESTTPTESAEPQSA